MPTSLSSWLAAGDYLTKPFGVNELPASLRATLRHHQKPLG